MTDNLTSDPAAYLRELQRIEREQELAKLRTLSLEFAGVLGFFPKLREELEAFHHADGIAFDGLADRLRPILKQSADIQFEIEHFPAELRNTPEIQAFIKKTSNIMSLQSAESFISQFQGICHEVRQRLIQEKITQENKIAKENEEHTAKIRTRNLAKKSSIIGSLLGASVFFWFINDSPPNVFVLGILLGYVVIVILGWWLTFCIREESYKRESSVNNNSKDWIVFWYILLAILWVLSGNVAIEYKSRISLFFFATFSSILASMIASDAWVKTRKEREPNKEKDFGSGRLILLLILWASLSGLFFIQINLVSYLILQIILTSLVLGVIIAIWFKTKERHTIDNLFRLGFLSHAGLIIWSLIRNLIY